MTVKKFHIKKISEIDKKQLTDFYQNSFNYQKTLLNNYNWRYRNRYNEHEPIVLIMDNQICGHAGLIPINFKIFKEQIKAIWFTDFFVIPKFRSLGFGKILTEEWMKICSTQITICNDQSLKVFKKLNWKNNNKFIRRIIFNSYFNLLPILKKSNFANTTINKLENLEILELNNDTINKIIDKDMSNISEKYIGVVRDYDWFQWRLIECPYKKNILIFKFKEIFLVAHLKEKNNFNSLNIIYSSEPINKEIINIFYKFSKKNNIDYLAYISNKKRLTDFLFPWQRNLNFAFHSKDKFVSDSLKNKFNDIQFIDSDIDFIG